MLAIRGVSTSFHKAFRGFFRDGARSVSLGTKGAVRDRMRGGMESVRPL